MTNRDKLKELQAKNDPAFEPGTGSCLTEALNAMGINVQVDEFFPKDELPELCQRLGLTYIGAGQYRVLADRPVIVIYQTDDEAMTHAVFTTMREAQAQGWTEKLTGLILRD